MDSWWEDMKACQFTDDQAEKFIMNRLMECFSDPMRDKINESFPVELERLFPKKKQETELCLQQLLKENRRLPMSIKGFFEEYRWLSNFWLAEVEYEGLRYPFYSC